MLYRNPLALARNKVAEGALERAISQDRLMKIDLSRYEGLITYPAGRDWRLERKRVLFLQAAVRRGFDWAEVVTKTRPYFGQTLNESFVPVVEPTESEPFIPPPYDIATQTSGRWAAAADRAWRAYRDNIVCQIEEWRAGVIEQGSSGSLSVRANTPVSTAV